MPRFDMRKLPARLPVLILTLCTVGSGPASVGAQDIPLDAPVPMDPAVTIGQLENGLRYYIRPNSRPEARAELRLVVNAGSILEDESQLGLAHLLEHMAFNGTANFEKLELVDYLESIGMAFGPSVNAYTSFDETVYMLQVPTNEPEVLGTAFQILEDWAHQITLDPVDVDLERPVVIEEWRLGRGASARILDQQIPVLLADSRYAERLPIGSIDVLETFPNEEIVRFYEEWYRPDLMAVVAVGDFDHDAVEGLIQTHFNRIPTPSEPLARPDYGVPGHEDTYFAIATDAEATSSTVNLLTLGDPPDLRTLADFRRRLVEGLAGTMLNNRLAELAQQADPPFLAAGGSRARFVRNVGAFQIGALVPEDGHSRGLAAVLAEAERAARHGFTATELERAKADLLRGAELSYNDRENQPSARFANAYVEHFLTGTVAAGIEFEFLATRRLVPEITVDDVNRVAQENLDDANRVVTVSGIERPELEPPTEDQLRNVLDEVTELELEPYEDEALDQPLIPSPPAPGSVVSESYIDGVDVTVWTLSNGATVYLKNTDFKEDEVVFSATSPGGWSRSSLEEHRSATAATALVQLGGLGEFSRFDLEKALAGTAASVTPTIGQFREGLAGGASPDDLETLLQLTWLHFTSPREDTTAFQAFVNQNETFLRNRGASPQAAFSDTVSAVMNQNHPRTAPPTLESLSDLDLTEALNFYKDRFASANDFSFVFVGAIDEQEVRPLVERYLASLPGIERDDAWVDLGIDPPDGVIEKVVRKGVEPQSQSFIAFTGAFEYTHENRLRIRALAAALQTRLRERLREDLGGTYSVNASASYTDVPDGRYDFIVSFGSDPTRAEELRTAVFDEIERLKSEGPEQDDIDAVLATERRTKEVNLESNGWWANQLRFAIEGDSDPRLLLDESRLDAVTTESMVEDAQMYLNTSRYVSVVLLPEGIGER